MSNVRILVVDDTPIYQRVVSDLFAQESGFEVIGSADNGRAALKSIHLLNPDLVILDVEMPVLDGFQTLQAIQVSYPELPVIMFSSLYSEALVVKAANLGAKDFVAKPTSIENREKAWHYQQDNLLATAKSVVRNDDY